MMTKGHAVVHLLFLISHPWDENSQLNSESELGTIRLP
jgi:hypothetical protein